LLKDVEVRHDHHRTLRDWLVNQYRQAVWRVRTYARHPDRTGCDGYSSSRDWASLGAALASVVSVPPALLADLWIVPVAFLVALAALQIPPTVFAIRDTGEWRHLASVPIQMLRSFSWLGGAVVGLVTSLRHSPQESEAMEEIDGSCVK
jgi:hypothetical protein